MKKLFTVILLTAMLLAALYAGLVTAAPCPPGGCPNTTVPGQFVASPYQADARYQSVVRVVNQYGRIRALGSGTLVDKTDRYGWVLTCAHLFREGTGDITVVLQNGHRFGARLLKVDAAWDLAVLLIKVPEFAPTSVATEAAAQGEPLSSCGYGPDGRFWCNRGRALGYVVAGGTNSAETLELTGQARQGDSGGPIMNGRRQLVGIILGTNGRVVTGTYCGRVRQFLSGLSPRFRQRPSTQPGPTAPNKDEQSGENAPNNQRQPAAEVPSRLHQLNERVTQLRDGLEQLNERFAGQATRVDERLGQLTSVADRISHRLQSAESLLDEGRLRNVISSMVSQSASGDRIGVVETVWPIVAAALGISTPPLIVLAGWKALKCWLRRRRRKGVRKRRRSDVRDDADRRLGQSRAGGKPVRKLCDEYAEQLHSVFGNSGRSAAQDATLGREYDQELHRAIESSDPKLSEWAKQLRDKVERKFHRIHGFTPAPVEPIDE